MNEKIKTLAKQAGIWFEDSKDIRNHTISTTTLERFALLIVEECADVAGDDWDTAGSAVRKHFKIGENNE
jgi:hypothetical protein